MRKPEHPRAKSALGEGGGNPRPFPLFVNKAGLFSLVCSWWYLAYQCGYSQFEQALAGRMG